MKPGIQAPPWPDRAFGRRHTPSRALFALAVGGATFIGVEFGGPNFWYGREVGGLPLHYLVFAGLLVLWLPFLLARPSISMPQRLQESGLWPWTVLIWVVLMLSIGYGIVTGAPELFADWRNLAVMVMVTAAVARWLTSAEYRWAAITDLAVVYGIFAIPLLALWALGGGANVFNVRVPLYFGPLLFLSCFSAIVAIEVWSSGSGATGRLHSLLIRVAGVSSSLVVILSFRRSFWLVWVVGMAIIVFRRVSEGGRSTRRAAAISGALLTLSIAGIFAIGPEQVGERLQSFLPGSETQYSTTNEDHIGDVLDALDVIAESPVFGLGIGRSYETTRIVEWKETSFEVHNALVHVWLKFGILGLIAYAGFHIRWILAMLRQHSEARAALMGTATYFIAEFLANQVGTWPLGSFQLAIHRGFLLGAFLSVLLPESRKDGNSRLGSLDPASPTA